MRDCRKQSENVGTVDCLMAVFILMLITDISKYFDEIF